MEEGWRERRGINTGKEKSKRGSRYMLRFALGIVRVVYDGERDTIIYRPGISRTKTLYYNSNVEL